MDARGNGVKLRLKNAGVKLLENGNHVESAQSSKKSSNKSQKERFFIILFLIEELDSRNEIRS